MKPSTITALESFIRQLCSTINEINETGPIVNTNELKRRAERLIQELGNESESNSDAQ